MPRFELGLPESKSSVLTDYTTSQFRAPTQIRTEKTALQEQCFTIKTIGANKTGDKAFSTFRAEPYNCKGVEPFLSFFPIKMYFNNAVCLPKNHIIYPGSPKAFLNQISAL